VMQFSYSGRPLRIRQDFWVGGAALRSENAEPHLSNSQSAGPEAKEFVEITGTLRYLRRDCAVNGHPGLFDVLKDALVGRWLASRVMLRLKAIDRYHDIQF